MSGDAATVDPGSGPPPPGGDRLPEDLDVTAYVGPYTFPDIARRRIPAGIYGVIGIGAVAAGLAAGNSGLVAGGGLLLLAAAYHLLAGWRLRIGQTEALAAASRAAGFAVGHASAQLGWRGLRSRPSWRILVYSAEEPPRQRGLVEVDGVDGTILGLYTEDNPEDWGRAGG
ncbi:MAG: hypothetical protein ACKOBG_01670 [Actinomycetota bacterium]